LIMMSPMTFSSVRLQPIGHKTWAAAWPASAWVTC
jgi:hypothetical protein